MLSSPMSGLAADRVLFYYIPSFLSKLSVDLNIPLCQANNSEHSGIITSTDYPYPVPEKVLLITNFRLNKTAINTVNYVPSSVDIFFGS